MLEFNKRFECFQDATETNHIYSLNLLYDYERYIIDFHVFVPLNDFIKGWTIIHPDDFNNLQFMNEVYDCDGKSWRFSGLSYAIDDSLNNPITEVLCFRMDNLGKRDEQVFACGALYSEPYPHKDYLWKRPYKPEVEEKWQTLIIKKNQAQS